MRNPFLRLVIPITILFLVAILAVFGYTVLEKWPLYDAVYMVVITLSTVGFREVHQLDSSGKILTIALILSGVGIMAYTVSQIVGIIIEGEIVGYRRRRKMESVIEEVIARLKILLENAEKKKQNTQLNIQQEVKMVNELPKFKGYTVDKKLKQFRKVDRNKPSIDFVRFDSEEGQELLEEYGESLEE